MNDKNYYCVRASFVENNLTMSVNVHVIVKNSLTVMNELFDIAERYFKDNTKNTLKKIQVFETESDMHYEKKCKAEKLLSSNS